MLKLLLPIFLISSVQAKTLSLEEVRELITSENELVRASDFRRQAREARLGHFQRSLIPELHGEAGYERYEAEHSVTERLTRPFWVLRSELNLFRGGADQSREQELQKTVELSKVEREEVISQLHYRAESLYWMIRGLENERGLLVEAIKKTRGLLREVERRVQNKVLRKADELKIVMAQSELEGNLKKNELELDESRNQLALLLGLKSHKDMTLTSSFPKHWPADISQVSENERPLSIQAYELKEEVSTKRWDQAKAGGLPEVDLTAHYGRPPGSDELEVARNRGDEFSLGVRVSWSLGSWQNNRVESKALSFERAELQARKSYQQRENHALDHELRHDIKTLSALIERGKREVGLAAETVKLVQSDFAAGIRSSDEVLESHKEWLTIGLRLNNYQMDYLTQKARLEWINR